MAARFLTTVAVLSLLAASACETCPLNLYRLVATGPKTTPCCEATIAQDVNIGFDDAQIDLSVQEATGAAIQVDAWVTRDSCDRLFDSGSTTPLCEILIGPVAAGTVSNRRDAPSGSVRIWVRPRAVTEGAVPYSVELGIWRHYCGLPR